jgi:hypothetical protein
MNAVQIKYTHECECKNDTRWNCSRNQGRGEWRRLVEGVNSSRIYLVHCKNLCKCYNYTHPAHNKGKINETSCNSSKWDRRRLRGRNSSCDLTNVQCKPVQNCHHESLMYNKYILIKKF